MLREYQSSCKRYFCESIPIVSMTEERMNKLLEDEMNKTDKNNLQNLDNLNNDIKLVDFSEKNSN